MIIKFNNLIIKIIHNNKILLIIPNNHKGVIAIHKHQIIKIQCNNSNGMTKIKTVLNKVLNNKIIFKMACK